jgi:hypothetical protein
MKNILTIFAGRKQNLEVLTKYLKKALELNILDEIHFWNYTRNSNDKEYLKTISNLKRTNGGGDREYTQIFTPIINNAFTFDISESNDVYIKINDNRQNTSYEIIFDGWINATTIVKKNNNKILNLLQTTRNNNNTSKKNIKISIYENTLTAFINNELYVHYKIEEPFNINDIYIKTGYNSVGNVSYETIKNDKFYFMDTCEKSWKNYYNYYDNINFNDDIIIKCDDDIVFIDLIKLPKFIDFIKNKGDEYDLIYANTINNSVCAYFQQNKYNLIPTNLMLLEYPHEGYCGTLWESGKKAEMLHNYFIENYQKFLNYKYDDDIIPITSRFSINFFGYKGNKWSKIKDTCLNTNEDEYILTFDYVKNRGFKNVLYTDFYVSHLSFFAQTHAMNVDDLINKYTSLYTTLYDSL